MMIHQDLLDAGKIEELVSAFRSLKRCSSLILLTAPRIPLFRHP
jgi:hypothetical protein